MGLIKFGLAVLLLPLRVLWQLVQLIDETHAEQVAEQLEE